MGGRKFSGLIITFLLPSLFFAGNVKAEEKDSAALKGVSQDFKIRSQIRAGINQEEPDREKAELEIKRREVELKRQEAELAQLQLQLKIQQEELARCREEMKVRLKESTRSVMQEKAFAEIMLEQQQQDKAKMKKIEKLWQKARKLYRQEMYEEAIKVFQRVIALEKEGR